MTVSVIPERERRAVAETSNARVAVLAALLCRAFLMACGLSWTAMRWDDGTRRIGP